MIRFAIAIMAPGGEAILDEITQNSGTASQVRDHLVETYADGRTDYLVLQLPTGDMTFDEAKRTLEVFIDEVMPALV